MVRGDVYLLRGLFCRLGVFVIVAWLLVVDVGG